MLIYNKRPLPGRSKVKRRATLLPNFLLWSFSMRSRLSSRSSTLLLICVNSLLMVCSSSALTAKINLLIKTAIMIKTGGRGSGPSLVLEDEVLWPLLDEDEKLLLVRRPLPPLRLTRGRLDGITARDRGGGGAGTRDGYEYILCRSETEQTCKIKCLILLLLCRL